MLEKPRSENLTKKITELKKQKGLELLSSLPGGCRDPSTGAFCSLRCISSKLNHMPVLQSMV